MEVHYYFKYRLRITETVSEKITIHSKRSSNNKQIRARLHIERKFTLSKSANFIKQIKEKTENKADVILVIGSLDST